jgi:hypothetical protein
VRLVTMKPMTAGGNSAPRIMDFSPRTRQFPKIRRQIFRQLQFVQTLLSGTHFAVAQ